MSSKTHYLLFALLLTCIGQAGAQVQPRAPFLPLVPHTNSFNSLFVGPGVPSGNSVGDPVSYELEANGRTANDGASTAVFGRSDATGPSCIGRAEGHLGVSASFDAAGAFVGARGYAYPQNLDITTANKISYATGGNFAAVATGLQFGAAGVGKYYVGGSWNTLSGTPTNYSPDGIMAAVIGTDYIKHPANTWAGYFEGRGYFSDRVGIGTTAPDQKLRVAGGNIMLDYSDVSATTGSLFFGGVTYPANQAGMRMSFYNSPGTGFKNGYIDVRTFGGTVNDGLLFRVDGATGNTERMRICANGKVGIGTGAPDQKLRVAGGNIMVDYSDVSATTGSLFFGGVTYPSNQRGMRMSFYNSPGTGFKNGYIDVRTFGGTATDGLVFRIDGASGNTERMRITSTGNVGIGIANPGTHKLYVNGTGFINSIWNISDQRLKKNIAPVKNALESVLALRGKTYQFDRENFQERNLPEGRQYGFLAQELRQVIPEAVMENTDGYLAVNYDMVIPVLAEAIKELNTEKDRQISEMEARLAEKDRQIAALEARLARLEAAFDRAATPAVEGQDFLLSNQPNPFSGTTTVQCTIPATVRTAVLVITDLTGREITRQTLTGRGQTSTDIDLRTAPNGTYVGTLVADGKAVGSLKLMVSGK